MWNWNASRKPMRTDFVPSGFSKDLRVERGPAPAAGFEKSADNPQNDSDFLTSIASARQEAQAMFELSQDLGNSLSLSETLSVLSMRLRKLIPYDSIAVFVNRNGWLLPELVSGENFRALVIAENPHGRGPMRVGSGELQAHHQRQPSGRSGLCRRPGKARGHVFSAGRSPRRVERRGRRAGHVSLEPRMRLLPITCGFCWQWLRRLRFPWRTLSSISKRKVRRPRTSSPGCPTRARYSCTWRRKWRVAAA